MLLRSAIFFTCFTLCAQLVLAFETRLEKIDGSTHVTGLLSDAELESRAIAAAFQKLLHARGQRIDSFTLVENGELLIDQIQASTSIKILNVEVLKSFKANRKYNVTVEVLYQNVDVNDGSVNCLPVLEDNIPISIGFFKDMNNSPVWLVPSELKLKQIFSQLSVEPGFKLIQQTPKRKMAESADYYNLFKENNSSHKNETPFASTMSITVSEQNSQNIIQKQASLNVEVKVITTRNGRNLATTKSTEVITTDEEYFGYKINQSKTRNRKKIIQKIQRRISETTRNHSSKLSCVDIVPTIKKVGNIITLNLGKLDGIKKGDFVVSENSNGTKSFYRIKNLQNYTSTLWPISRLNGSLNHSDENVYLIRGS